MSLQLLGTPRTGRLKPSRRWVYCLSVGDGESQGYCSIVSGAPRLMFSNGMQHERICFQKWNDRVTRPARGTALLGVVTSTFQSVISLAS